MDMLNGGLAGKLILFSLPLACSSILQQLFNSADVAVVGRFAGDNALSAVGSCVALVGRGILELSGTPVSVLEEALLYIRIYFISIPFMMIYNFGSAALRSFGDTRRPMYYLILSGVINVILNLVLVICFGLGVAGVAIAGSSLALNFEYFTYDIANAFAQAAVTFTSQNYGAGNVKRCKKIFWLCMALDSYSQRSCP